MKTSLVLPIATLGLVLVIAAAGPIGSAHAQEKQIYGRELMTEQERTEFRLRLQELHQTRSVSRSVGSTVSGCRDVPRNVA
jgi:hypothetical protein